MAKRIHRAEAPYILFTKRRKKEEDANGDQEGFLQRPMHEIKERSMPVRIACGLRKGSLLNKLAIVSTKGSQPRLDTASLRESQKYR
eukprot:261418-Pelagomonas_calceolata.AAC.1